MKKFILIMIALAVQSFGQTGILPRPLPSDGNYQPAAVLFTYDATDSTYHAVLSSSGILIMSDIYSHPPTHFLATTGTDTVGGSIATSWIDTLTSVSSYYQTWSVMPLDDTLQVSVVSGTFTTAQILLPYQSFTVTVDPTANLRFYIRRYGTSGTVTYQIYGGGY